MQRNSIITIKLTLNMRFTILSIFLCLYSVYSNAQNMRGVVIDAASNAPIPFATVVLNTMPRIGVETDSLGNFNIKNIPIGRYNVTVSSVGYTPSVLREIQVSSSKETYLNISLKESVTTLNEVIIKPQVNKDQPLNDMATVSARMLSVEESKRYAGGFDDPARLASVFAGVASNTSNNGIVIRGNAPKSLQWKIEGVEIPNPNHFADLSSFGGGGLTALSSQMLANSDFLTAAFPAEYNNTLSGVFDIAMRKGNTQKHENTIQIGAIGIDIASEGPFKKEGRSSYLFNYRYSTLALLAPLLPENGGGVRYQDVSFKFNFPTQKAGTFSIWGIGLIDHSGAEAKMDSLQWQYMTDKERQDVSQYMGAWGLTHKYFFNNKTYLKTTLATTVSGLDLKTDELNAENQFLAKNAIKNQNQDYIFSTFFNTKVSAKHSHKTGFLLRGLRYDMALKNASLLGQPLETIVDEKGLSSLLSIYSQSNFQFTDKLNMNIGVNAQIFMLNKNITLEPRMGIKWQIQPAHALGLGYGLHSRLERLNYYFIKNGGINTGAENRHLDFTKAHHLVASYDASLSENMHLKIETYFQHLFNVPVLKDSSFSFINLQNDWFFNKKLENTGKGKNYGLDLTLEKYLSDGYYFLVSASIFQSKYQGGDKIWRNTRFNRNYLFNFLIGKEWQLGMKNNKILGINTRFAYQGGDRYSPINTAASLLAQKAIYDESNAFEMQLPATFTAHFTASYKINKSRTAHEIALKILNATMQKDYFDFQYNFKTKTIDKHEEVIFIPNISYKFEF